MQNKHNATLNVWISSLCATATEEQRAGDRTQAYRGV